MRHRPTLTFGAAILIAAAALQFPSARGAPSSPRFGPLIEAYANYDGQDRCSPDPKPGVEAFRARVMGAYPWTGDFGISRACYIGGQSEHKEGRAWDWAVSASSERDRGAVSDLFDWLFSEDRYGNGNARARRVGVMYLIWNRRIWFPGSGWRTYCVQRRRGCVSPSDGGIRHPHTDHVHFSFTWDGARRRTTFHHNKRSLVTAASPLGSGFLLAGGNGGVRTYDAGWYGDASDGWLSEPVVASGERPQGDGYWLVGRGGRVHAFGNAPERRGARDAEAAISDVASTATGAGYWIVSRAGEVFARGDAGDFGEPAGAARIVAIAPTATGAGYWMATSGGRVLTFGDAVAYGDLGGEARIVDLATTTAGDGYWLLSDSGDVYAFGAATHYGSHALLTPTAVALLPTPTDLGYRTVTTMGRVYSFGDGTSASYRSPSSTPGRAQPTVPEEIPSDY
jgi:hypothetical protein